MNCPKNFAWWGCAKMSGIAEIHGSFKLCIFGAVDLFWISNVAGGLLICLLMNCPMNFGWFGSAKMSGIAENWVVFKYYFWCSGFVSDFKLDRKAQVNPNDIKIISASSQNETSIIYCSKISFFFQFFSQKCNNFFKIFNYCKKTCLSCNIEVALLHLTIGHFWIGINLPLESMEKLALLKFMSQKSWRRVK